MKPPPLNNGKKTLLVVSKLILTVQPKAILVSLGLGVFLITLVVLSFLCLLFICAEVPIMFPNSMG